MKQDVKIVYLDIETAPLEVYAWGLWDVNVAVNQIKTESSILSMAWLWEGEKYVYYSDTRDAKDGPRNDRVLVAKLWHVLDEADIVVTQNGKKFDVKRLNARFIAYGLTPPSSFRHIDTKEVAKQVFAFTSNRLEWLAKHIAGSHKMKHGKFPGFELWKEIVEKNNPAAWAEMEKYNRQDVKALRALYLKLRPWIKNHPNMGQYSKGDLTICPKCGSSHLQARGFTYTITGKYQRLQCQACGGWARCNTNLLTSTKRKALIKGD